MISWEFTAQPPSVTVNYWVVNAWMPGSIHAGHGRSRFLWLAIHRAMKDAG